MTTWNNQEKAGFGWDYDEINLAYDDDTDPYSGNSVLYNAVGTLTVWSNQSKS